jgi:hypothetical protein
VGKPLEWIPRKGGSTQERRTKNEYGDDGCRQSHGCKPDPDTGFYDAWRVNTGLGQCSEMTLNCRS